jgi:hypothetical protein
MIGASSGAEPPRVDRPWRLLKVVRVIGLFLPLFRNQQRAAVEALVHVATTQDHTTQLLACSLLEAADRLNPMLIKIDDVERLARSANFSLRSSAAVLLWQWATSSPGRVPIPLLGRLTQPSTEDWYVHAAARAGAKQLLVARGAARAIFDRMAASHDPDDRDYAAADLLEVAGSSPTRCQLIWHASSPVTKTGPSPPERPSCCAWWRPSRKKTAGTTTASSGCDGPVSSPSTRSWRHRCHCSALKQQQLDAVRPRC